MIKKLFISLLLLLFVPPVSFASHQYLEKEYQEKWSNEHRGVLEYVLDDNTRVDCLLPEYAVEFDFAPKVYESIGQAFYYASKTGRKPAIVLIMEHPATEQKYLNKLKAVSKIYGIKYWVITTEYLSNN